MGMTRWMCKSKIHRATVTEACLEYEGSITVDSVLMDAADIRPYEMVQVMNINNGERFETYAIPGKKDSGAICLNGAAARKGVKGDKVIIMSTCQIPDAETQDFTPKIVFVNEKNQIVRQAVHEKPFTR
jgi:aspartate 1-decarboxylase